MQKGYVGEHPNVKEGRSNLTNQPWATPPALGSSEGYKDQPKAKIGNNLRKNKVRRSNVAKQRIQ